MQREATLTEGPVARRLALLTAPMVLGMFSIFAFNLVDTMFVARLGTRALAAMSFTFPEVMFVAYIALGLVLGCASVISRPLGEWDR